MNEPRPSDGLVGAAAFGRLVAAVAQHQRGTAGPPLQPAIALWVALHGYISLRIAVPAFPWRPKTPAGGPHRADPADASRAVRELTAGAPLLGGRIGARIAAMTRSGRWGNELAGCRWNQPVPPLVHGPRPFGWGARAVRTRAGAGPCTARGDANQFRGLLEANRRCPTPASAAWPTWCSHQPPRRCRAGSESPRARRWQLPGHVHRRRRPRGWAHHGPDRRVPGSTGMTSPPLPSSHGLRDKDRPSRYRPTQALAGGVPVTGTPPEFEAPVHTAARQEAYRAVSELADWSSWAPFTAAVA